MYGTIKVLSEHSRLSSVSPLLSPDIDANIYFEQAILGHAKNDPQHFHELNMGKPGKNYGVLTLDAANWKRFTKPPYVTCKWLKPAVKFRRGTVVSSAIVGTDGSIQVDRDLGRGEITDDQIATNYDRLSRNARLIRRALRPDDGPLADDVSNGIVNIAWMPALE